MRYVSSEKQEKTFMKKWAQLQKEQYHQVSPRRSFINCCIVCHVQQTFYTHSLQQLWGRAQWENKIALLWLYLVSWHVWTESWQIKLSLQIWWRKEKKSRGVCSSSESMTHKEKKHAARVQQSLKYLDVYNQQSILTFMVLKKNLFMLYK